MALVGGQPRPGVRIEVAEGRIQSVAIGAGPGDATRLSGFTLPGLANAHSHAFHRALRARVQAGRGTFWTWRELMYRAAERLQPDSYHRLARAVFAEMALAGVSSVGEFHYLHHQPDGTPYDDPNEMGAALLAAASEAGIRITLLDTLYLHGGLGSAGYEPLAEVQRRFGDGSATAWAERVEGLGRGGYDGHSHRLGAAIHSVRAVDSHSMRSVGDWTDAGGHRLHVHVSEQVAENDACIGYHGLTPVQLLEDVGLLSDRLSVVHATHVAQADVDQLAAASATVVMCPTTERDLGDGIGPTSRFAAAGVPMALGSDSHAVIDLFEEARSVELNERLRSHERGIHSASALLAMATVNGQRSLGWDDAGVIAPGKRADLATINPASVRTAGASADLSVEATVFAATASDITDVHVDGQPIVTGGRHRTIDVAAELDAAIGEVMDDG